MNRASFPALGTTAIVAVVNGARLQAALNTLEHELAEADSACSRFRPDSDLSRVNASSGAPVPVGRYLADALRVALRAAAATGGLVDPTIGRPLRLAGYDRTYRLVCARNGATFRPRFEAAAGWQTVALDPERQTVRVPAAVELDLGATAKALAADRAARRAAAAAGCGVLVSIGGDVAVAGQAPNGGWAVGIGNDHAGRQDVTVALHTGGMATSSITVRRWRAGELELHHVIDPKTGRSAASPWQTATVAAGSCVDANVAATAAIVLGDAAPDWLVASGLPARLVTRSGSVERVAGWPEDA